MPKLPTVMVTAPATDEDTERQFVIVLTIDEEHLDGDDSIENACAFVNGFLGQVEADLGVTSIPSVRPLSEVLAC